MNAASYFEYEINAQAKNVNKVQLIQQLVIQHLKKRTRAMKIKDTPVSAKKEPFIPLTTHLKKLS